MVVLSNESLPHLRMAVDEFLTTEFPEGFCYELVEGEIEVSYMPAFEHDDIVSRINDLFVVYRQVQPGLIGHLSTHTCVTLLQERTARVPDYAVYGPIQRVPGVKTDWRRIRPILVIEVVSEDRRDVDYVEKRRDYWNCGVTEYWIVDGYRGIITILRRGEQDWHEMVFSRGEIYPPQAFPGMDVDVATILGH